MLKAVPGVSYQAGIRNANKNLIVNQPINLQLSILIDNTNGNAV